MKNLSSKNGEGRIHGPSALAKVDASSAPSLLSLWSTWCSAGGHPSAPNRNPRIGELSPHLHTIAHTSLAMRTKKNKKKEPEILWEIAWWFSMQQEAVLICPWSPKYPDTRHAPIHSLVSDVWLPASVVVHHVPGAEGTWDIHLLHLLSYKTLPAETRWAIKNTPIPSHYTSW